MSVAGHSRLINILTRLADARELAHGYLFLGPKGVGKRRIAESLAHYCEGGAFAPATKVLNDARVATPSGEGSIGIDAVGVLRHFLYERPNVSSYRMAIVDSAERLTPDAQNALLKVAEEPPSAGVLMLLTSDEEALFSTLRSRLHRLYFSPAYASGAGVWLDGKREGAVYQDVVQFLKTPPAARREYVKKLVAPVGFDLGDFLDHCLIAIGEEIQKGKGNYALWHKVAALRGEAARGTLNPRVQLLALLD
jgi:phosphoribosyl-AMP cyclohydrolase